MTVIFVLLFLIALIRENRSEYIFNISMNNNGSINNNSLIGLQSNNGAHQPPPSSSIGLDTSTSSAVLLGHQATKKTDSNEDKNQGRFSIYDNNFTNIRGLNFIQGNQKNYYTKLREESAENEERSSTQPSKEKSRRESIEKYRRDFFSSFTSPRTHSNKLDEEWEAQKTELF